MFKLLRVRNSSSDLYDWNVLYSGFHVATFSKRYADNRRGYYLCTADDRLIKTDEDFRRDFRDVLSVYENEILQSHADSVVREASSRLAECAAQLHGKREGLRSLRERYSNGTDKRTAIALRTAMLILDEMLDPAAPKNVLRFPKNPGSGAG